MNIELSKQEVGLLLSAMIEKQFETKRYLSGWDAPEVPSEQHSCCEFHRHRYERDREMVRGLTARQEAENALVARLTELENE